MRARRFIALIIKMQYTTTHGIQSKVEHFHCICTFLRCSFISPTIRLPVCDFVFVLFQRCCCDWMRFAPAQTKRMNELCVIPQIAANTIKNIMKLRESARVRLCVYISTVYTVSRLSWTEIYVSTKYTMNWFFFVYFSAYSLTDWLTGWLVG